jgi:hypothetical protein
LSYTCSPSDLAPSELLWLEESRWYAWGDDWEDDADPDIFDWTDDVDASRPARHRGAIDPLEAELLLTGRFSIIKPVEAHADTSRKGYRPWGSRSPYLAAKLIVELSGLPSMVEVKATIGRGKRTHPDVARAVATLLGESPRRVSRSALVEALGVNESAVYRIGHVGGLEKRPAARAGGPRRGV